jgi:hypothetical protein
MECTESGMEGCPEGRDRRGSGQNMEGVDLEAVLAV